MRSQVCAVLVVGFLTASAWMSNADELSGETKTENDRQTQIVIGKQSQIFEEELKEDEEKIQELKGIVKKIEKGKKPIPTSVVTQLNLGLEMATAKLEQARQGFEAVKSASNVAEAQVYFKEARLKAEVARNWIRRAQAARNPTREREVGEPVGREQKRGSLLKFESEAFQQLIGIEGERRGFTQRVEQQMADAVNYDPESGLITMADGRMLNVAPVVKAVNKVLGTFERKNIFESVQVPGRGEVVRLKANARPALSSLQSEQGKEVGGVALEVTLDTLSFLGVPDFRHRGPTIVIESPVLISLTSLYSKLWPFAKRWEELPDELRYPGFISRIHGFVLDSKNKDVFLVGSRARLSRNRIDIDSLIIGFQSVWKEGLTPAVSLDPLPDDPGGPQYPRVMGGVPKDSIFAKIMLDADYVMKRITFGDVTIGDVEDFRSLKYFYTGKERSYTSSRLWFYPMALGPNNIHLSATERTVLYETGVRLLTEQSRSTATGTTGTSSAVNPYDQKVVDLFTEHYQEFESSKQVKPGGIFLKLHGLIDVVTVCKLWRSFGIDYPILDKFSRLPLRNLQGSEAVPSFYPGITTQYAENETTIWVIMGGVQIRPRASRNSLDKYQDLVTATLEHAVDTFPRETTFAKSLSLSFNLPRSSVDDTQDLEKIMSAGRIAMIANEFEAARTHYKKVVEEDPFYADAWMNLAIAEATLGNQESATDAINKALAQDPGEKDFNLVALHIYLAGGLEGDLEIDLSGWEDALLKDLSEELILQSLSAVAQGLDEEARKYADTAIMLWDDNPDAYYFRALALSGLGSKKWDKDIERAIRLYRKLIRRNADETNKHRLAFALTWRARQRLYQIHDRNLKEALADSVVATAILYQLQRAVDDAREASKIDPSFPLAITTEAEARTRRVSISHRLGKAGDYSKALSIATKLTEQFPDYAPGHRARAVALAYLDRHDEAINEFTEVLSLNPFSSVLFERAALYLSQGNCRAARSDIEQIEKLGVSVPQEIKKLKDEVEQCR